MARETPYPFVKWAGGKGRMLGHILPRMPHRIDRYFEPFVGAGALFFELTRQKRFKSAHLGDVNPELMNAYRVLKDAPAERELRFLLSTVYSGPGAVYGNDRDSFLKARSSSTDSMTPAERAARFIYLNRTCFNGLYRVNKSGRFNVPFGRYKDPTICDSPNLEAVSKSLRKASLHEQSFQWVEKKARPGDVVYLDPPYMPISETSKFTSYTDGGFTRDDQVALAMTFARLADKGVCVILSNSAAKDIYRLYRDYEIVELMGARNVGGPASYRKPVKELMVLANASAASHPEAAVQQA